MTKTRKKKLTPGKAGNGSLIAQLQYVRRQLVAADNVIAEQSEQARRDRNEILRLSARETELVDLLHDAVRKLEEETSAHETARQAAMLYKASDERAEDIIGNLKADVAHLKDVVAVLKASLKCKKADALRVIDNYRNAGALLGVKHVEQESAPDAHTLILCLAEDLGIEVQTVYAPLAEMLTGAERKSTRSHLPPSTEHLRAFLPTPRRKKRQG